jgi:hypothetical protein
MFTDRFIKLPIEMFNRKEAELTDNPDAGTFESYGMFNAFEISSYWPAYNNDGEIEEKVTVYFKNGESVLVLMPIAKFEQLLNNHFRQDA